MKLNDFQFPNYVEEALRLLHDNNYKAYLVGGCIRDILLGIHPKDFDITTNATPEQIKEVFKDYPIINPGGEKHGTVSIVFDEVIEITTFRKDSEYSDNRHPDKVEFVSSLDEDLARRDFTINAIAYDGKELFDPFNGINDLENKILKTVNNAADRFNEDALRILRGIRFACKYNLSINDDTLNAMISLRCDLNNISKERILKELNGMIIYEKFFNLMIETDLYKVLFTIIPELSNTYKFSQKNKYHQHDLFNHLIYVCKYMIKNADNIVPERYKKYMHLYLISGLLHDIGKYACFQIDCDDPNVLHFVGHPVKSYEMTLPILDRLKYSNKDKEIISWIVLNHDTDYSLTNPKKTIKKLLSRMENSDNLELRDIKMFGLFLIREGDKLDHNFMLPVTLNYITNMANVTSYIVDNDIRYKIYVSTNDLLNIYYNLSDDDCFTLKDLEINGYDVMKLGFKNKSIGLVLNNVLNNVVNDRLKNDKEEIITYIKNNEDIQKLKED